MQASTILGGRLPEMKKRDILDSTANFAVTWAALLQDLLTQAKEQSRKDSATKKISEIKLSITQSGQPLSFRTPSKQTLQSPSKVTENHLSRLAS